MLELKIKLEKLISHLKFMKKSINKDLEYYIKIKDKIDEIIKIQQEFELSLNIGIDRVKLLRDCIFNIRNENINKYYDLISEIKIFISNSNYEFKDKINKEIWNICNIPINSIYCISEYRQFINIAIDKLNKFIECNCL